MKSEVLVKRNNGVGTIEDDFIAAEFAALIKNVFDQRAADAMFLVIVMDRDIFDMSDDPSRMDEFWFNED